MLTLLRQGSELSQAARQRQVLAQGPAPPFAQTLAAHGRPELRSTRVDVLQVNVGKLCNQTCAHCHVDAGPERREIMTRDTMAECLAALERGGVATLDITGGAPEMNPNFRWFAASARALGKHVIDRCNLTILLAPGFTDLPEFLAAQRIEIVASLPCYLEENADRQRGSGVFRQSIEALRRLNALGYGDPDSGLTLNLVYNPVGPSLPPPQAALEAAYKRELAARHGVWFNRLYAVTNQPISRFLDDLLRAGQFETYLGKLAAAFNPAAVEGLMCRGLLSVDWQGNLYDCDFNQMLELPLAPGPARHVRDFDSAAHGSRRVAVGPHCYACAAGQGSSCQGALG